MAFSVCSFCLESGEEVNKFFSSNGWGIHNSVVFVVLLMFCTCEFEWIAVFLPAWEPLGYVSSMWLGI